MLLRVEQIRHSRDAQRGTLLPRPQASPKGQGTAPFAWFAFTLVEVMVVMALTMVLIATGIVVIGSLNLSTKRTADYNAALAVVEAKVQDIRGATYNPPLSPWTSSTVYLTNNNFISLDKAGVSFKVPGTVISQFTPVAAGHLVTVTGTFQEPSGVLTVSLQTVVNRFTSTR